VQIAIDRFKEYEPPEGFYLAFSGGKDSVTIKALADMAGVKYDAHYSLTTVDPPELVHFIKRQHPDVEVVRPLLTMWQLIPKKLMPPTRSARYCCAQLKETGGIGRTIITGVRRAESTKRAKRPIYEAAYRQKNTYMLCPIIDWTEGDVWEFIRTYQIPYCSLYDEGWTRLGCVGCPMAGTKGMTKEFERWPTYKRGYLRAFEKMLVMRKKRERQTNTWETPEDVMEWWIGSAGRAGISQCDEDQKTLFD